jgi:hypothetical protein
MVVNFAKLPEPLGRIKAPSMVIDPARSARKRAGDPAVSAIP